MCYSSSLTSKNIDLKKKYKKEIPSELAEEPLFHVSGFVFPEWRVITDAPEIQTMRWGLIPNWYKGPNHNEMAAMTLNARTETVFEKASFKHLIGRQHCIVPATGFFEYQTKGKEKIPYFVYPKKDDLFSMAGIYDTYVDTASGEIIRSYSILTTEANELMADIHNSKKRMPVMLNSSDYDNWLNKNVNYEQLFLPAPNETIAAHKVDPKILKGPEQNSPKAQEKFERLDYTQGSLF